MATDRSNVPSLSLFTRRHSYVPFRSLSILARPVHSHPLPLPSPSTATILRLPPSLSSPLYTHLLSSSAEFFPHDIRSLLSHSLTLGSFFAFPSSDHRDPLRLFKPSSPARDKQNTGNLFPRSFALLSLWNAKEVLRLRVRGGSRAKRRIVKVAMAAARAVDRAMPRLNVPSVRDVFRPFGIYVMYGLYMEGERGAEMMEGLCRLAHNVAMGDEGVAAVVAEVGEGDPVRAAVPHWRRFSCEEDVWCMKRLVGGGDNDEDDWSKCAKGTRVMFVDPREF